MNQKNSPSILEKAYKKLIDEYQRLDIPDTNVKCFGLNPGWNAVIGTNGCCGVAMSFQENNPLYGIEETLQDLDVPEILYRCFPFECGSRQSP